MKTDTYARRAGLVVGGCALVGGAVAINHSLIGVFYDDGLYAGIAVALSNGQGYVHPHLPGAPAVVHYPPLYPLVLAPLFGTMSVAAAGLAGKLLNLSLAALTAALIAWHAVRRALVGQDAPRWLAPACVAMAALAIPVLTMQSVLFAEPLFGLLVAVAVIIADAPPARWRPSAGAAAAGLVAALALLTRTIGVAAGAGIVLFFLTVRRMPLREALYAALPVGLAVGAWGTWTVAHRGEIDPAMGINYGSYAEVVAQSGLAAFGSRAPDLARPLAVLTLGWLPVRSLYYVFCTAALAVGIFGFWLLLRRSAIGFSLLFYFAILAVWPFYPDRFLWAVLPWLALVWAAGAVAAYRALPRFRLVLGILLASVLLGYGQIEARGVWGRWWGTQQAVVSANFSELLPWLASLPPDAVLACDDEALVWLYTRRTTVPFYVYGYKRGVEIHASPAEQRAYLERMGVTQVLLASSADESAAELNDLLGAYPGWLTVVHTWPGRRALFQVHRER